MGSKWKQLARHKRNPKYREGERPRVYLSRNGKLYQPSIASLVLTAFVGPRPAGMEVCHSPDSNTANNRLENIRWGTKLENENDKKQHGTTPAGERNPKAKLTELQVHKIRELHRNGVKTWDLVDRFGVSFSAIRNIVNGHLWTSIL
jgi:hypothetical protein